MVAMIEKESKVVEYPTELTAEVVKRLSAPVPASEIQHKEQGKSDIQFTTDKFVHRRLNDVVGVAGWQVDYTVTSQEPVETRSGLIIGQVVCRLKVLGVMKSAAADLELTKGMYGTPATNAQARAFKRAAMLFGIAAELWDKDAPATGADPEEAWETRKPAEERVTQFKRPQEKAGVAQGGTGLASPKQVSYLKDAFGVPAGVAAKLTSGREGQASQLIEALREAKKGDEDAYGDDPIPFIRRALKKINPKLVPLLDEDEDDEDED